VLFCEGVTLSGFVAGEAAGAGVTDGDALGDGEGEGEGEGEGVGSTAAGVDAGLDALFACVGAVATVGQLEGSGGPYTSFLGGVDEVGRVKLGIEFVTLAGLPAAGSTLGRFSNEGTR